MFAGLFSQDLMKASAYRYANIQSRLDKPGSISLLIADRTTNRKLVHYKDYVNRWKARFPVWLFQLFSIGAIYFLHKYDRKNVSGPDRDVL